MGRGGVLEVHHQLQEFSKQQRVFVTAHLFLGRSLLFPESALDLFGCCLGATAGGVEEDAGLQCWATMPRYRARMPNLQFNPLIYFPQPAP